MVTSAGFGWNMHHTFRSEQRMRRCRGDRRLLSNGIVLSSGVTWPPNPVERSGRWARSGEARKGSGKRSKNAVQLNPALVLWSPQNFNQFSFFPFFLFPQSTPSVIFLFSSICSCVISLLSFWVQFQLPLSLV